MNLTYKILLYTSFKILQKYRRSSLKVSKHLVQSIRFYFLLSLLISVIALILVDLTLYNEGENIRKTVHKQSQLEAQKEIENAIHHSLTVVEKQAAKMAKWDEVHQQLNDPSYYFFWHDERLKESSYFKQYYEGLELYNPNKSLLMPSLKGSTTSLLPNKINSLKPTLVFDKQSKIHLNIFHKVTSRNSNEVLGYIGISVDFDALLLTQNTFYRVDKSSIHFIGNGEYSFDKIMKILSYKPTLNPVNDYLWQLIQNFIIELSFLMLIIALLVTIIFNDTILKPLRIISNYLHQLKNNPQKIHPIPNKTFIFKEFEEFKKTIHDYHYNLQKAHKELDKQNHTVWEQARRDVLTNIYNRRAFEEAWQEITEDYLHNPTPTTFMLFDCDFFKALNDTYGHEVGDQVIKLSAITIQQNLPLDCPVYRIGGDEFAVLLQKKTTEETVAIAKRCLLAIEDAPFNSFGIKEHLTFSVGVSSTMQDMSNDITQLPKQADIAMYKTKQSLKEKIQCYHCSFDKESMSLVTSSIINTVVEAIHSGVNIQMNYQPIKCLADDSVYYESLIRIKQGDNLIYPNDIFSVVDRRRLEFELDQQVIHQTNKALKNGVIPKGSGLAVNISGKTLLQPRFPELFKSLKPFLDDYKIVLEITENSLIDHMEYAQVVLNDLRSDGFLIALDDFGSGYSSIRYLAHMPVDIIKFDITMTRALLDTDIKTQSIIKTTAEMILNAGYDLVMEGIEDDELLQKVISAGATHVQGYLIAKPSSQANFE